MKKSRRTIAMLGAIASLSVVSAGRLQERRRRLALVPIKISKGAGMTERRCRRRASLRARSRIVPPQ